MIRSNKDVEGTRESLPFLLRIRRISNGDRNFNEFQLCFPDALKDFGGVRKTVFAQLDLLQCSPGQCPEAIVSIRKTDSGQNP